MERQRADRISIEKAKRGIAMLRNGTAGKAKTGEGEAMHGQAWTGFEKKRQCGEKPSSETAKQG
jgi:hypothetical protein